MAKDEKHAHLEQDAINRRLRDVHAIIKDIPCDGCQVAILANLMSRIMASGAGSPQNLCAWASDIASQTAAQAMDFYIQQHSLRVTSNNPENLANELSALLKMEPTLKN